MKMSNYLYVFNHVISKGEKREGVFYSDELFAWHDIDGYACYIGYKDLTMTLYFHGQFSYDYQDKRTFKDFDLLVESIVPKLRVNI
tara:strand:- start:1185 stop:1442 length:258 start_codon:yes stop_codon:yes gene_type:complete